VHPLEPILIPLAQVEQADNAQGISGLDDQCPENHPFNLRDAAGWPSEHGGPEQHDNFDAVAPFHDLHGKANSGACHDIPRHPNPATSQLDNRSGHGGYAIRQIPDPQLHWRNEHERIASACEQGKHENESSPLPSARAGTSRHQSSCAFLAGRAHPNPANNEANPTSARGDTVMMVLPVAVPVNALGLVPGLLFVSAL